ncbi:MAG: DUF5660 domain-containing protein [Candidatus Roizmanbacteria bacterium]|nr:DUF5660 domain-containing protein [Candidatus Roizmanbacteria bacterium]
MKKAGAGASKKSLAGSVFEGLSDIGKQTVRSAGDNIGSAIADGARSLAGLPFPSAGESQNFNGGFDGGIMSPERMGANPFARKREKPRDIELFSFAERRETLETTEQIKKLIVMIKEEVKKIETQNKMMITETAKITVEQMPDKPGIYHIRFFEWLLNLLTDIRKRVTESASWLSIAQGKKAKKGYWGMAKKKGTSFTLSGERTASTQSG